MQIKMIEKYYLAVMPRPGFIFSARIYLFWRNTFSLLPSAGGVDEVLGTVGSVGSSGVELVLVVTLGSTVVIVSA